jgi:hypothetical protein
VTNDNGYGDLPSADAGTAGHSARRRRAQRAPAQLTTAPPGDPLGPVNPPITSAAIRWDQGASGEELTARLLAPLARIGWVILHDRRIPGTPANLDHLLIGAGTVWVVDTKAWRGRVKLLGDGRLWYGRTHLDQVLAAMRWQAHVVAEHVQRCLIQPVPIRPVLCLHGVRLPADPLHFDGVTLVTGARLLRHLATGQPAFGCKDTRQLATRIAEAFPSR